jgi:hypothetical protein
MHMWFCVTPSLQGKAPLLTCLLLCSVIPHCRHCQGLLHVAEGLAGSQGRQRQQHAELELQQATGQAHAAAQQLLSIQLSRLQQCATVLAESASTLTSIDQQHMYGDFINAAALPEALAAKQGAAQRYCQAEATAAALMAEHEAVIAGLAALHPDAPAQAQGAAAAAPATSGTTRAAAHLPEELRQVSSEMEVIWRKITASPRPSSATLVHHQAHQQLHMQQLKAQLAAPRSCSPASLPEEGIVQLHNNPAYTYEQEVGVEVSRRESGESEGSATFENIAIDSVGAPMTDVAGGKGVALAGIRLPAFMSAAGNSISGMGSNLGAMMDSTASFARQLSHKATSLGTLPEEQAAVMQALDEVPKTDSAAQQQAELLQAQQALLFQQQKEQPSRASLLVRRISAAAANLARTNSGTGKTSPEGSRLQKAGSTVDPAKGTAQGPDLLQVSMHDAALATAVSGELHTPTGELSRQHTHDSETCMSDIPISPTMDIPLTPGGPLQAGKGSESSGQVPGLVSPAVSRKTLVVVDASFEPLSLGDDQRAAQGLISTQVCHE